MQMTDHSELKRLAEALSRAIEQAEHKPGHWAETAQSMGGICEPIEVFQIGKPWTKEEPWAHFSYKRDSWLAVAAVNALPKLLALIAERDQLFGETEQLKAEVEELRGQAEVASRALEVLAAEARRYRFLRNSKDEIDFSSAESMEEIDWLIDMSISKEAQS
jgi:hypothetical protein